jgi:hypothetical protein
MISKVEIPSGIKTKLQGFGMPSEIQSIVDAVEWLRTSKSIYVDVYLSTSEPNKARYIEYVVRVTDGSGGNISRVSSNTYPECLCTGLDMVMRIFLTND